MKKIALIASVLLLSLAAANVRAAGATSFTLDIPTVTGTGPWGLLAGGNARIDSTVMSFDGISYYLTDPNGATIPGYVGLASGNPTAGGAAVPWTGATPALTVKGDDTVHAKMMYHDANNGPQLISLQKVVTVP